MESLTKWGSRLAVVGGISWVIKFMILYLVFVANLSDPGFLIDVFYFGGWLGPVGAALAISSLVIASRNLAVRIIVALVLALLLVPITFVVQDAIGSPFRGAIHEDVATEIPILIIGLLWVIAGALIWRRAIRKSEMATTKSESESQTA